jgi:hypothetical protein
MSGAQSEIKGILRDAVVLPLGVILIALGRGVSHVPWIAKASFLFTVIGIILVVIGLLAIGWRLTINATRSLWDWLYAAVTEWASGARYEYPHAEFAAEDDLADLQKQYCDKFKGDAPSLEKMREWYAINPRIFLKMCLVDIASSQERIVASVKLVPLCRNAVALLEAGSLKGTEFSESHIMRRGKVPSGWYIGDLVGSSRQSGGHMMKHAILYLDKYIRRHTPVYARPLTKDGLRLIEKYKFTPVSEKGRGHIYRVHGAKVQRAANSIREVEARTQRKKASLRGQRG